MISRAIRGMDLTDAQWDILREAFVEPRRVDGKGRPPGEARAVLNGVLWILRTGAPWKDLPDRYPPIQPVTGVFRNGRRTVVSK